MVSSYYEFHNPVKIISGNKALENLPSELGSLGISRPLVVTDRQAAKSGCVKILRQGFKDSNTVIGGMIDDIHNESSLPLSGHIADVFQKNGCDGFVVLGGKSVADTVKGANIIVSEGTDNLLTFSGYETLSNPLKPVAVVPYTCGSGTPVSRDAVISDAKKKVTVLFSSRFLMPDLVVLDPRILQNAEPESIAASGMGALCRAVEAATGQGNNPMGRAYAHAGIDLLRSSLITAVRGTGGDETRLEIANAEAMAGIALANASPGMLQALGDAVASVSDVPADTARGILLPVCLEYILNRCESTIAELLLPLAGADEYARTPGSRRALRVIACIRELQKTLTDLCSFPQTLKQAGLKKSKVTLAAEVAFNDPCIVTNPREVRNEDAVAVLLKAFE